DTLNESGYPSDKSEELVGRLMSVVDSTDHFITLATSVLDKLCEGDFSGTSLPLISIMSLNLLLCLLQRTIKERTTLPEQEEEEEDIEIEGGEGEGEDKKEDTTPSPEETLKKSFYDSHAETLIPVLLKVSKLILSVSHHGICIDIFNPDQNHAKDMIDVIKSILGLSGTKLLVFGSNGKLPHTKDLFVRHIPVPMSERLKTWNSAMIMERSLCNRVGDKVDIIEEMFGFLHSSLRAISGRSTFSPNNSLKSNLFIVSGLLHNLFSLSPADSSSKFSESIVPLAMDLLLEFAVEGDKGVSGGGVSEAPLREMAKLFDEKSFALKCMKQKVINCFQLVQCPPLGGHTFQGSLLEDLFILLNNLLDSSPYWPILAELDTISPPTIDFTDLLSLCSLSSLCTSSLTEGLKLFLKILELTNKEPHDHLSVLCGQIARLSMVPQDQLVSLLQRIVLGCVSDSVTDSLAHTNLLYRIIELLTKEDCCISSHLSQVLLINLIPIGKDLIKTLHHLEGKQYTIFKDYFQSCVLLAGNRSQKGHLELVRAASDWLPLCFDLVKNNSTEWKNNNEILLPLYTVLNYVSSLSSAAQLLTNKEACTERRALAAEDDYAIL
ncbi:PREDICTED: uncharacterized protein LOC109590547, partial [Amphimedon queenslandica]|uniref:E3 ubiquitin-protein ligase UBR4 N-terminal domain-containing protein n=1 Tax=Amphimedon queenslandica TaxID=400682 RepID=A0AAN0JYM7_AMPQE